MDSVGTSVEHVQPVGTPSVEAEATPLCIVETVAVPAASTAANDSGSTADVSEALSSSAMASPATAAHTAADESATITTTVVVAPAAAQPIAIGVVRARSEDNRAAGADNDVTVPCPAIDKEEGGRDLRDDRHPAARQEQQNAQEVNPLSVAPAATADGTTAADTSAAAAPPTTAAAAIALLQQQRAYNAALYTTVIGGGAGGNAHNNTIAGRFRTRLCKSLSNNSNGSGVPPSSPHYICHCKFGNQCMFAHSEYSLRTVALNERDGLTSIEAVDAFKVKEAERGGGAIGNGRVYESRTIFTGPFLHLQNEPTSRVPPIEINMPTAVPAPVGGAAPSSAHHHSQHGAQSQHHQQQQYAVGPDGALVPVMMSGDDMGKPAHMLEAISLTNTSSLSKKSPMLFRTQLCNYFAKHNHCKYIRTCVFAHGPAQQRSVPQNLKEGLVSQDAIDAFINEQPIPPVDPADLPKYQEEAIQLMQHQLVRPNPASGRNERGGPSSSYHHGGAPSYHGHHQQGGYPGASSSHHQGGRGHYNGNSNGNPSSSSMNRGRVQHGNGGGYNSNSSGGGRYGHHNQLYQQQHSGGAAPPAYGSAMPPSPSAGPYMPLPPPPHHGSLSPYGGPAPMAGLPPPMTPPMYPQQGAAGPYGMAANPSMYGGPAPSLPPPMAFPSAAGGMYALGPLGGGGSGGALPPMPQHPGLMGSAMGGAGGYLPPFPGSPAGGAGLPPAYY